MFEKLLIFVCELFKASGSFWALHLARQSVLLGIQNGGWHLFLLPVALFLVCVSILTVVDCGINVYHLFLIDVVFDDDDLNHKSDNK